MITFASFNANIAFDTTTPLDTLSFASLGQANVDCSKAAFVGNSPSFTL